MTLYPQTLTPERFIDALNANAGGALSQAERDMLASDLKSGAKTRAQVLRAVAEDTDLSKAEFNRAFMLMQYFGHLRRDPDSPPDTDFAGYNFWLGKLNQFGGNFIEAEMVKAFLHSTEYRNRLRVEAKPGGRPFISNLKGHQWCRRHNYAPIFSRDEFHYSTASRRHSPPRR